MITQPALVAKQVMLKRSNNVKLGKRTTKKYEKKKELMSIYKEYLHE